MTSIDSLPTEILIRVFSFLETSELFNVENVCRTFQSVLQEFIWSRITNITSKVIEYPDKDFLHNFLKIAQRVVKVKEFIDGSRLVWEIADSNQQRGNALKSAFLKLISKHSSDAIFPFDLIQNVLSLECIMEPKRSKKQTPLVEVRQAVANALEELRVGEFEAIRINEFCIHDRQAVPDCFTVSYRGRDTPIPFDYSRITRLYFSCFIAWFSWIDREELTDAKFQKEQMKRMNSLHFVEIDTLQLELPAPVLGEDPVIEIRLFFHPHRCHFTASEFSDFLELLTQSDDSIRNKKLAEMIDQWKSSGALKRADISFHSREFKRIEDLVRAEDPAVRDDPINRVVSCIYPVFSNDLHLAVSSVYDEEERFITFLQDHDLFSRLKKFSMAFVDQRTVWGEMIGWDVFLGTLRAEKIIRLVSQNMQNLEALSFGFGAGGRTCLSSMFKPVALVTVPLPKLKKVFYYGFPCFPFLISVVQQASNLLHLTIGSQPFEEENVGLEWIKKILVELNNSSHLSFLFIKVSCEEQLVKHKGRRTRTRRLYRRDKDKFEGILGEIDAQLNHLVSALPQLRRVSVNIENLKYEFDHDRRRPNRSTEGE